MRPHPRARRGFTLLEAMISLVLLSIVSAITFSTMFNVQAASSQSAVRNSATSRARRLVEQLVIELQDLNVTADDLEPDAPFDSTYLEYRKCVDYDTSTDTVTLEPTAASGNFYRVWLSGDEVLRAETSGGAVSPNVALADQVSDLRFTLSGQQLTIHAEVQLTNADGDAILGVAEVTVLLHNSVT